MGSCDDDKSQAPSVHSENDDDAVAEEPMIDPEEVQQEAWAAAEGYTPLADLSLLNNPYGSMMVSMGPGCDSDADEGSDGEQYQSAGGTFFVNPSAFSNSVEEEEINIEPNHEDGQVVGKRNQQSGSASIDDYEGIAEKALAALDEEYVRTIGEAPSNLGKSEKGTRKGEEKISDVALSTDILNKDDLKLIAAAFDEKKAGKDSTFCVDWDHLASQPTPAPSICPPNPDTEVDTDAVRKAVLALSEKADKPFQKQFAIWEQRQQTLPPRHILIPQQPYNAFLRSSAKAVQATGALSRSATIAEALIRLESSKELVIEDSLIVDVIGVDHVECESVTRIQSTFRPIVRWLGVTNKIQCKKIIFRLIGRDLHNVVSNAVDLLTPNVPTKLESAVATCHSGVYDEWLQTDSDVAPNFAIAFNAGIWGYTEWKTTISYLNRSESISRFVITAYTLDECQEDFEVIKETVNEEECKSTVIWGPQLNPFASKILRETKSSSQDYHENSSWQAWSLGGSDHALK